MEQQRWEIRLPDLGEVEDVRVIAWLKAVGDRVQDGDDLVEVETEKTTFVIPSPHSGRLARIAAGEGASVVRDGLLGELDRD
jgi:pyruvate/2-oxoglutarate dehydrogenase complex dihydrolipoamide acyltransferase (E2) component